MCESWLTLLSHSLIDGEFCFLRLFEPFYFFCHPLSTKNQNCQFTVYRSSTSRRLLHAAEANYQLPKFEQAQKAKFRNFALYLLLSPLPSSVAFLPSPSLILSLGIYWALYRWGKPFHREFSWQLYLPSFCLLSPSLNRAHSDMVWKISSPCTC